MNSEETIAQANDLDSDRSKSLPAQEARPSGWLRLGAVAAASVLAGGLAAAWWYRKTLTKLHESREIMENTQFGISRETASNDILDDI